MQKHLGIFEIFRKKKISLDLLRREYIKKQKESKEERERNFS